MTSSLKMFARRPVLRAAALVVPVVGMAGQALAITDYFDALRFVAPAWTPGSAYTTSQQWDTAPNAGWTAVSAANGLEGNFAQNNNPTPLAAPLLTATGNTNDTPYFFNGGNITATVPDYGGALGTTATANLTRTRVTIQLATTTGGTGAAISPDGLGSNIAPGSLRITAGANTYTAIDQQASPAAVLLDKRVNAAGFSFSTSSQTYTPYAEQWLYTFTLPTAWTGNLTVAFDLQIHGVFEAMRVETALLGIPGDYNSDGRVDSADYTVWADHFGSGYTYADGNGDGKVDSADYTIWADNFGKSSSVGAASIPEPGALCLIAPGALLLTRRRK